MKHGWMLQVVWRLPVAGRREWEHALATMRTARVEMSLVTMKRESKLRVVVKRELKL